MGSTSRRASGRTLAAVRRFALGWGRQGPERWVIGVTRPGWLDLVAPPDAAPRPPGSEPDVVIVPHTAAGRRAPDGPTADACGPATLGRPGNRAASGLLDVFRDGDRPEGPPSDPDPERGRHAARPERDAAPLERTVVALGARTEGLAAHLERLEGRLERLAVDLRDGSPRPDGG
jgi:hypothetical protein